MPVNVATKDVSACIVVAMLRRAGSYKQIVRMCVGARMLLSKCVKIYVGFTSYQYKKKNSKKTAARVGLV